MNKLNSLPLSDYVYDEYIAAITEILAEINYLTQHASNESEKKRLSVIWKRVSDTIKNEIGEIRIDEEEMRKQNVKKIRRKGHYKLVTCAWNQVHAILSLL